MQTEISVLQEMGGLSLISAKTEDNDGTVAECRMKIFLKID